MDGDLVCACLVLGAAAAGRSVQTVESLSDGDTLHPVQRAFVDAGAVQCGFCTPGLIVATYALLQKNPEPSDKEVREALSGNICRCTGYGKILEAVDRASAAMYRR
jgi:carbon-monoxide dehydrogenase small subunit